jgi:hypothetical protein
MKFILSLFLSLFVALSAMGDAVIFSGSDVKTLKQNIDLFGVAKILSGSLSPADFPGVAAPQGSIYLSTQGDLYEKFGPSDVDWASFVQHPEAWVTAGNTLTNPGLFLLGNDDPVAAEIEGRINGNTWMFLSDSDRKLYDVNGNVSVDFDSKYLFSDSGLSQAWGQHQLYDLNGYAVFDYGTGRLGDTFGNQVIQLDNKNLLDTLSVPSLNWQSRQAYYALGNVAIDYAAGTLHSEIYPGNFTIDFSNLYMMKDSTGTDSLGWGTREVINSSGSSIFNWSGAYPQIKGRLSISSNMLLSPVSALHIDSGNAQASAIKLTAGTTTGQASTDGFELGITTTGIGEIRQRENLDITQYTNNTLRKTYLAAGGETLADAYNIAVGTTTGTKIGTATSQKLGFFNATPVIQQTNTTEIGTVLSNLGLRASGTAYPITTSGTVTFTDNNIVLGTTTGTKIGTATTQKLAFYNSYRAIWSHYGFRHCA